MSKLGDVLSKLVLLNRFKDGGLGVEPPASEGYGGLGRSPQPLGNFGKKKAILMPLDQISHVFGAIFEELDY